MACCLFGAKTSPELMLAYCQLDSWEQISVKFESEFYHFHSRKCIWNCHLPKWWPFCPGWGALSKSWTKCLVSLEWYDAVESWMAIGENVCIYMLSQNRYRADRYTMTSSNGNIFHVTGYLWGNSPVTGEFPSQRPVTRSFDVFFDLHLNKQLSKQSWGWWFEMPSHPLCCHCNDILLSVMTLVLTYLQNRERVPFTHLKLENKIFNTCQWHSISKGDAILNIPVLSLIITLKNCIPDVYILQIYIAYPHWIWINSLGPSDAIWHRRSWSTLVHVMACCLAAPSHYLNQFWLIISKVLRHSSEDIIIRRFEDTNQ